MSSPSKSSAHASSTTDTLLPLRRRDRRGRTQQRAQRRGGATPRRPRSSVRRVSARAAPGASGSSAWRASSTIRLDRPSAAAEILPLRLAEHLTTPTLAPGHEAEDRHDDRPGRRDDSPRSPHLERFFRPAILRQARLLAAIERHLEAFERQSGIRTKLTSSVEHIDIDGGQPPPPCSASSRRP